jgi:SAM-dependent methyltransferase
MSTHTMPMTPGQEQTGYIVEVSDPEHERLVRLSRVMEPYVWDTLARLRLAPGSRVLEYGCGPLGALLPLSAAVGPDGVVVGVDRSGEALDKARAIMAARGVGAVRLVQADLTTLTPAEVCPPGPFDLAYGHFVLCYQRDVVGVLQRIAATVRPGGYIVAQEALLTAPIPVETPGRFNRAANLLINEWLPALLGTLGTCWDVAERYSMLCREAGLVEVSQRLFTPTLPPAHAGDGTGVYRDILAGVRPLLRRFDIASEDRIDRTLRDLDMAIDEGHDTTIFTHIQIELVARVP